MIITAQLGLESLLISPPNTSAWTLAQATIISPLWPSINQNCTFQSILHSIAKIIFLKCPCERITLLLNLTRFYNAWLIKPQSILLDLLWAPHSSSSHSENISTPQTLGLDPSSLLARITLLSILPCLPPASGSFSSLMFQLGCHFSSSLLLPSEFGWCYSRKQPQHTAPYLVTF